MPGTKRKPPAGKPVYFCDECGSAVLDDSGYLTVEMSNGRNRWRCFHDACRRPGTRTASIKGKLDSAIVRLSRVATYPLLLTTMASLASDLVGFEGTNWPTFFARIASDSEWSQSDGRRRAKELEKEHLGLMHSAFGGIRI